MIYTTEVLREGLCFHRERAQDCFEEAMPLLQAHKDEIAHYPDVPLDPDFDAYRTTEDAGMLRAFTIREHGVMKGYAVFFVRGDVHYRSVLMCAADIIYLDPALRGALLGMRFLQWCGEQLEVEWRKAGGPEHLVVSHHIKAAHDWGLLLKRLGYEHVDQIWWRRVDREGA